jgi:hypothetical protein
VIRTSTSIGLALGLAASAAWVGLTPGTAAADSSYDAVARTDVSTVTIENQSIPTGIAIEGGGPVARVHQDSVGIRDASAALPYAGDTVAGLPGLGASLFGFSAPPYPFVAASTAGTDPQTVRYPGMTLTASSADFTTDARSEGGDSGSGASATSHIEEQRLGDVIATATTGIDSVRLGPYGTLSNVSTLAKVTANGNTGKVTRSTTSSIGHISVPGLTFTVPKQSPGAIPIPIPIPGVPNQDPIPAPPFAFPGAGTTFHDPDLGIQDGYFTVTMPGQEEQKYVVPAGPVLEALKASGISLSYQAPQATANGIIAGTYIVSYTIPAPPANSYYTGPTKITQTLAYGLASVDLTPVQSTGFGTGTPAGAVPGATDAAALPGADLATVPGTGVLPGTDLGAGVPTVNLVPSGDAVALAGAPVGHGIDDLYLIAIAAAVIGVVAAALFSRFAVRNA